jgi:hypothetical protein
MFLDMGDPIALPEADCVSQYHICVHLQASSWTPVIVSPWSPVMKCNYGAINHFTSASNKFKGRLLQLTTTQIPTH